MEYRFKRKKLTSGFTLLETVVALAVLMAAVVGPVSLITRGIFNFSFSKNKLIAVNLAQEGMELVRLVRENNIICDVLNGPPQWDWNRDPEGGNLIKEVREVAANQTTAVTCGSTSFVTPRLSLYTGQFLKFDNSSASANYGLYNYSTGNDTVFARQITVCNPPNSGPPNCTASADSGIPAANQMDVLSTVTWKERGTARTVTLRERLYNWK